MPHAIKVLGPGDPRGSTIDTLILNAEQRRVARGAASGAKGTRVEFDLPVGTVLHTDDVLLLDSGDVVEIVAEAEPLLEVRADIPTLARIAWALGDRHLPVQVLPNRIRFRRDGTIEHLIASLGGRIVAIEAPFEPEGGAYSSAYSHQAHSHDGHGEREPLHEHSHDRGNDHHHHHDESHLQDHRLGSGHAHGNHKHSGHS
jgi:urease accessory protein